MSGKPTRGLVAILALVVIAASGGWIAGRQVQSPADAAADAAPPPASRITVPVEERVLSSDLVLRGTVQYAQPTPVQLAGAVGTSAGTSAALVTRAPEQGTDVSDGMVVLEVSGRPVFAVQGAQPTFRQISPGISGPDVRQLEEALQRFGFSPGAVDGVYDDATESAVDRWYDAAGYVSQGPTDEQRRSLRELRSGVAAAQDSVRTAERALADAARGPGETDLLRLQKDVTVAEDAVEEAKRSATRGENAARLDVAEKTTARDRAIAERDAADLVVANATAATAVNPTTGEPYTEAELTALRSEATARRSAVTAAQGVLDAAVAEVANVGTQGARAVQRSEEDLKIAQTALVEGQRPKELDQQQKAVADARSVLEQAQRDLADQERTTGTVVPAGEILFFPSLPLRIDAVQAKPGDAAGSELMTVTGAELAVDATVAVADAKLLQTGARAVVTVTDLDIELTGQVTTIADRPGTNGASDSRVYVRITPDDLTRAAEVAGALVRILVPIESTGGAAVLAVPLAALSTGADGSTRVQVERGGEVETVQVRLGLSAQGYAQVTPMAGSQLAKGDRVIVGTRSAAEGSDTSEGDEADEADDSSEAVG